MKLPEQPLCACGCGQIVPPPREKRRPQARFLVGHANKINANAPRPKTRRRSKCGFREHKLQLGDHV